VSETGETLFVQFSKTKGGTCLFKKSGLTNPPFIVYNNKAVCYGEVAELVEGGRLLSDYTA
jgi:hypothetical protein